MPPEDTTNKNVPNFEPLKIGLDPVFKGSPNQQRNTPDQGVPSTAYNVLNNQEYSPAKPVAPFAPEKTGGKEIPNPKSLVRTFKGDLAEAIQTGHLSSINIAIAENDKMHSQVLAKPAPPATPSDYSRNKIIIFASVILIIVGLAGFSLLYLLKGSTSNTGPAITAPALPSLITTEYKDELNLDLTGNNNFISTLASKLNDTVIPANSLYNIYLTTGTSTTRRLVTSSEFVSVMGFNIPDIIKRALAPDFMVGTFSLGKDLPFVILKTSSFENAYAGMLTWETDLARDFGSLFRISGYENTGVLSQLTPTTIKKFEDAVVVNKDVRLLRDASGQIIILYGIIDTETIVIAANDIAFKEIVGRLNKEKTLAR